MELYIYKVLEVKKIYDGDTFTVVLDLGMKMSAEKVIRWYGIDTPEIRGEERPDGLISKAWVVDKINKAIEDKVDIYVQSHYDKTGKYGRLLGTVYIGSTDEISLNEQLVTEGLAEVNFY